MKRIYILMGGLLILALLNACGSSAPESAVTEAPAPTLSPTDTPLPPTPAPLDLNVLVVDESGVPIPGAEIIFPEAGAYVPVKTDEKGAYSWTDLKKDKASLKISAQGYNGVEETLTLAPGANEFVAKLIMPPHALLASQACAPGETFLYAEDFQDGKANGWGAYPPGKTVTVEADIDVPDNMILLIDFGDTDGEYQFNMEPPQSNVVWRLKYKPGDHSRFNVGLGKGEPGYFTVISGDEFSLSSYSNAEGRKFLSRGSANMDKTIWHLLEFSSYSGRLEVWADGVSLSYDGALIPDANKVGVGSAKLPPDSFIRVDNVSLCGLNAPFTSMYAPSP